MTGQIERFWKWRSRDVALGRAVRLLVLWTSLLLPAYAEAQRGPEEVEVAAAALRAIRESLPSGPAALDPEAFCKARLVGWDCPAPLQNAADVLGFRLNSRTFVRVCMGGEGSCRLVGAESLVVLEAPEIRRNSATLSAQIWWRTGEGRPLGQRRMRVSLTRRSGTWTVDNGDAPND